jgi:Na+-translocating ferredoxin:NAD+ oxidoreductase RnfG subunit
MSAPRLPIWPITAIVAVVPASLAIASSYLTVEAAQRALFPQAQEFTPLSLTPTTAQLSLIARAAGPQAAHGELRAWAVKRDGAVIGHVFVDNVVGRQDFITYAVGIDAQGALKPVEILEYRESHGGEIRNARWLAQFEGRRSPESLRFRADIKNIAGATLSSEHVTAGVRRILALWQQTLSTPGAR